MNILFISKDLSGGDLAFRLKQEGHAVRLFVDEKEQTRNLEGMVEKTKNWKKELSWVGKDGLIVSDNSGFGKIQDELREKGYSVVGNNAAADRLEHDRQYGQKIMSACGLKTTPSMNFTCVKDAVKFIKKNGGKWVIKQNGHVHTSFNYVGRKQDGSDVISMLENYNRNNHKECSSIDLQKRVNGVEIGVARYFNGTDWVGPIEFNVEHKGLCNGDLGPKTFEMGTLMWYDGNEKNKLFRETIGRMKDYLKSINFRGDFDINCIVNEKGVYPLEITARFGWPSTHLQEEFHISKWGEFLKSIADGKPYKLKYRKGYGVVVLLATPPFPYEVKSQKYYPDGLNILFKKEPSEDELGHIHWEEVSARKEGGKNNFYITGKTGFILHMTGMGKTIAEARKIVYQRVENVIIPKMFYRTDIGLKFMEEDRAKLIRWGWI